MADLVSITCCVCEIEFGMPQGVYENRKEDHKLFSCPNGHGQYYSSSSEKDKLKKKIKALDQKVSYLEGNRDYWRRIAAIEERRRCGYQGYIAKLKGQLEALKVHDD